MWRKDSSSQGAGATEEEAASHIIEFNSSLSAQLPNPDVVFGGLLRMSCECHLWTLARDREGHGKSPRAGWGNCWDTVQSRARSYHLWTASGWLMELASLWDHLRPP